MLKFLFFGILLVNLSIFTSITEKLHKMIKKTIQTFLTAGFLCLTLAMTGQNSNFWQKASLSQTRSAEKAVRNTMPQDFQLFSLNTQGLKNALTNAPARSSGTSNVTIKLPTNNGELQEFRIYEASVMAPELQAQHPDMRQYVGQGVDDKSAIARFSISNTGLNVMISSGKYSTIYIDPYTTNQNYYISYNINSLPPDPNGFECFVQDTAQVAIEESNRNADDGKLRTFRLAVACTGEYSVYHLNRQGVPNSATDEVKKAAVLSAIVTSMTRVNGVYEREVSLTMVLVPNEEDIIFLNAGTDPFTNNNAGTLINQSQTVIDQEIGTANYDIGHTFSTGAGGLAGLRVPCTSSKARGVTGTNAPVGDFYDIDYVAHEMGHQYGANHTFNGDAGACGGGNRNNPTAFEPGSGSTIMAYAGICAPQNVQPHSDDYFTAISIQEMWANITSGNSQCAAQTDTNNLPPTADAGESVTIPGGTPFILAGIATDADTDANALTHCWEQMDNQIGQMPPQPTSVQGPMFRSIDPLSSPERYMPNLTTVLAGQNRNLWEVTPTVSRFMRFRYTVRDNAPGGSASASSNMVVNIDGDSGPFAITSQNDPTTWTTRENQTITWDVANSDQAPVNCAFVNIVFSSDRGATFDQVLLSNTPNNGSAVIQVPAVNTTQGRIMIKAVDNIFFDINNRDITVEGSLAADDFAFDNFSVYPNPTSGTVNVNFTALSSDNVEISLYDQRGRLINTTNFTDVSANGNFNKQLQYGNIDTGIYFMVIKNAGKTSTQKLVKK